MTHENEEIIDALKKGREAKGLSQRALSARTGVPQSHISKIENGSTDIRLSSLIALARALELEVKLVPRKALPAVDSIVRSTSPAVPAHESYKNAARELQRTLSAIDKLRLPYPELSALTKMHDSLRTISNFKTIGSHLDAIRNVSKPLRALQKQADQFSRIEEAVSLHTKALRQIEDAAENVQHLRNQLVHQSSASPPRAAYRLDDDDDDDDVHHHDEHEENGNG